MRIYIIMEVVRLSEKISIYIHTNTQFGKINKIIFTSRSSYFVLKNKSMKTDLIFSIM